MLYRRPAATKHRFILDYLLQREDIEVCNYINEKGFSLATRLSTGWYARFLKKFDHQYVCKKNKVKKKIKLLLSDSEIKKDDIIISYVHYVNTFGNLDKVEAFKVVSALHLYGSQEESKILAKVNPNLLYSEFDITKHSAIFNKFFCWYSNPIIIHPFAYAERFKNIKKFEDRECRAFSPGTIIYTQLQEFTSTYGTTCFQVSRKQIFDNKDVLQPYIACYNNEWNEGHKNIKAKSNLPGFIKVAIGIYNSFHIGQQKSYFSFDMVERYNNFKMFVCGEETTGSPAVGFVEGMACGAAFIGNSTIGCYEDYGMVAGVHYIGYNGDLDDLIEKIKYYQKEENQSELKQIANAGYEFAVNHFTPNAVASCLIDKILKEHQQYLNGVK